MGKLHFYLINILKRERKRKSDLNLTNFRPGEQQTKRCFLTISLSGLLSAKEKIWFLIQQIKEASRPCKIFQPKYVLTLK